MFFVRRNEQGEVISVSKTPEWMSEEVLSDHDPEIKLFFELEKKPLDTTLKTELQMTDIEMARVIEDLIELLIQKKIILFTDLPIEAQRKFLERKKIRDMLDKLV